MNHNDHVNLLRNGITGAGKVWADFGSGNGAFTLALADLLGAGGEIYSLDKDQRALREQERALRANFPATVVHYLATDFTRPLDLPALDGIVMANSLHFQRDKGAVIQLLRSYLRPSGHFVLVEYNADRGNMWVPYPLSYPTWEALARREGFATTHLLATIPSRFLGEIYSALSILPDLREVRAQIHCALADYYFCTLTLMPPVYIIKASKLSSNGASSNVQKPEAQSHPQ